MDQLSSSWNPLRVIFQHRFVCVWVFLAVSCWWPKQWSADGDAVIQSCDINTGCEFSASFITLTTHSAAWLGSVLLPPVLCSSALWAETENPTHKGGILGGREALMALFVQKSLPSSLVDFTNYYSPWPRLFLTLTLSSSTLAALLCLPNLFRPRFKTDWNWHCHKSWFQQWWIAWQSIPALLCSPTGSPKGKGARNAQSLHESEV